MTEVKSNRKFGVFETALTALTKGHSSAIWQERQGCWSCKHTGISMGLPCGSVTLEKRSLRPRRCACSVFFVRATESAHRIQFASMPLRKRLMEQWFEEKTMRVHSVVVTASTTVYYTDKTAYTENSFMMLRRRSERVW